MNINKLISIGMFLFISTISFVYIKYKQERISTEILQNRTLQLSQAYKLLYRDFKNLSHLLFDTQINRENIISIFKDAYISDEKGQNFIRKKLYESLKEEYKRLTYYNIRQLHFHLPNNDSFLRFHRPQRYGDNLTNVRPTIAYVNANKNAIDGFEEGRIFSGYRFVYPLFDNHKKHIGSVEISFSMLVVIKELTELLNFDANFIILKSLADKKVFKNEKSKYIPSYFKDYYFEKEIYNYAQKHLKNTEGLSASSKTFFYKNIAKAKPFSFYDEKLKKIISFIPIKNPITQRVIASIVVQSNAQEILKRSFELYLYGVLAVLLLIIILYILYRELGYRERLSSVINEADSGIGIMTLEGDFLEVNQQYCEFLGYSHKEMLQLNCFELIEEKEKDVSKKIFEKARTIGKISKVEKSCIKKDGKLIHFEISLALLPSKKEFAIVVNSLETIIELENFNKNLWTRVTEETEKNRQKDRVMLQQSKLAQMGEMLNMIAHQWRQPLSAITATSGSLELKAQIGNLDNATVQELSLKITEYAQHLSSTIDDFRNFFKENKEKQITTLEEMLHNALNIVNQSLENAKIELSVEVKNNFEIRTYKNEVKQVILNIIKNAEDALMENNIQNPKINISISDYALTVSDNAGGIEESIKDKIFEPYFSTKIKKDGTGLGLYMSKTIIEEHCRGKLSVSNSESGAVFKIELEEQKV